MSVRQLSTVLEDVAIRRIRGGDEIISAMNQVAGQEIFARDMTGEDILVSWMALMPDMRAKLDQSCAVTSANLNELLDEVYRIREEDEVAGTTAKEAVVNTVVISVVAILVGSAIGLISLYGSYANSHGIDTGTTVTESMKVVVRFFLELMSQN